MFFAVLFSEVDLTPEPLTSESKGASRRFSRKAVPMTTGRRVPEAAARDVFRKVVGALEYIHGQVRR